MYGKTTKSIEFKCIHILYKYEDMQTRTEYQKVKSFYKSKHNNIVWLIRKMVLTLNFSKVEAAELAQIETT